MWVILFVSVVLLLCSLLYVVNRRLQCGDALLLHLPPGPSGLPIVGMAYAWKEANICHSMQQIQAQYGPIALFHIFQRPVLLLSSWEVIRSAIELNLFHEEMSTSFTSGGRGLCGRDRSATENSACQVYHHWCAQYLRTSLPDGRSLCEAAVLLETQKLCQHIEQVSARQPMNTLALFGQFSEHILSHLLFGETGVYDSAERRTVLSLFQGREFPHSKRGFWQNWNGNMPSLLGGRQGAKRGETMIRSKVQQYKAREGDSSSHFMEAYSRKKDKLRQHSKTNLPQEEEKEAEEALVQVITELFQTGVDTTSAILTWSVLLLAQHPDVADLMREEIDAIIGPRQQVVMIDNKHFHYCSAVMDEILRFSTVLPLGLGHRVGKQTKLEQFDIPSNTTVLLNLYRIHRDPELWENGEHFDPQHFLFADGETYNAQDHFLPFGSGKQACVGEILARIEIFIVLISLLQKFHFKLEEDNTDANVWQGSSGWVRLPGRHRIVFQKMK